MIESTKLKVCGMKYVNNIVALAQLEPDFMGFIFYPRSKRFVGDAFKIPEINSLIKKVGVFVNESKENILEKVAKHKLDYVQLHGNENADYCENISHSVKIIKAFGMDKQFDFTSLHAYEKACEYFLFDTKTNEYGGSGKSFDRSILENYKLSKPYFLSGGIGTEDAINSQPAFINAFALDVNSMFEIEPGLKDINKLKSFKDELSGK